MSGNGAPRVAIIGTGFSGLCMAIQLKKAGFTDFTIFEKSDRLGGTWRDNTYPGSGCDVPSFFYSFSFEVKTDWSRKFADQPEILEYLEFCCEKYGLATHIMYNTEIAEAKFDSEDGLWRLTTAAGETFEANVLVSGCGQLNRPYTPSIEGMDSFSGVSFHSARWNHEHDLSGERVAVVGNGASALQLIPEIAPKTEKLYVFQRSANWIVPKPDREYSDRERSFFTGNPLATRLYRALLYSQLEARWPVFSKKSWLARRFEKTATKDLDEQIADPKLRESLLPDYPVGCKRILISSDYYEAVARDNVEVVTSHIARITENAVETEDGRNFAADTIIFATGFETSRFLAPMTIRGLGDAILNEVWRDGAEAYMGVAVGGFPNLFILYGPNTNLGHNSILIMVECQVRYVIQCLEKLVDSDLRYLDVRQDVMVRHNAELQRGLKNVVWDSSCTSWYKNDAGKITNNWPYSTIRYWWRTRHPDWSAFHLEARGA